MLDIEFRTDEPPDVIFNQIVNIFNLEGTILDMAKGNLEMITSFYSKKLYVERVTEEVWKVKYGGEIFLRATED